MQDSLVGKLKKHRKEKGLSQELIAKTIGVSLMTVQRWESGKYKPSLMAQNNIKRILGI